MIDLHSHILARLDDGPSDAAVSVAMARAWATEGVHTVAATPHVNLRYDVDADVIARAVTALNDELRAQAVPVTVVTGAEVDVQRFRQLSVEDLRGLTLAGGDCLLLECPLTSNASYLEEAVFDLQVKGMRVLLAHPERSPLFIRDIERLRRLVESGALCSITAGSMEGQFGTTVRDFTVDLFAAGLVHNVASDAHDDHRRPPGFGAAFAALEETLPGLAERSAWYTEALPAALLKGGSMPAPPPAPARSRRRGRFPWQRKR